MIIRHAHLSDLPYVYEICHRTGFEGGDASQQVSDRLIIGQYFAAPYVVRDPAWCWIAADEHGPAGYLVATPDSRAFGAWMDSDWLPAVQGIYATEAEPSCSDFELWLRAVIHKQVEVPDFVDKYPAHLHIDILPRAQGQGLGSKLVAEFIAQLRAKGVPGFHLGVGIKNTKAQAFYSKQGLEVIRSLPGVIYMGLHWD
jgi:ribosomal protein S18 acetylase RimI-like enzyme